MSAIVPDLRFNDFSFRALSLICDFSSTFPKDTVRNFALVCRRWHEVATTQCRSMWKRFYYAELSSFVPEVVSSTTGGRPLEQRIGFQCDDYHAFHQLVCRTLPHISLSVWSPQLFQKLLDENSGNDFLSMIQAMKKDDFCTRDTSFYTFYTLHNKEQQEKFVSQHAYRTHLHESKCLEIQNHRSQSSACPCFAQDLLRIPMKTFENLPILFCEGCGRRCYTICSSDALIVARESGNPFVDFPSSTGTMLTTTRSYIADCVYIAIVVPKNDIRCREIISSCMKRFSATIDRDGDAKGLKHFHNRTHSTYCADYDLTARKFTILPDQRVFLTSNFLQFDSVPTTNCYGGVINWNVIIVEDDGNEEEEEEDDFEKGKETVSSILSLRNIVLQEGETDEIEFSLAYICPGAKISTELFEYSSNLRSLRQNTRILSFEKIFRKPNQGREIIPVNYCVIDPDTNRLVEMLYPPESVFHVLMFNAKSMCRYGFSNSTDDLNRRGDMISIWRHLQWTQ